MADNNPQPAASPPAPVNLREWIPQVYRRACEQAHRLLYRWKGVNRPDTASLVDRAVCELLKWGEAPCQSREHALALLIQKMRHVSLDMAKALLAEKRGGPGRGRTREPGPSGTATPLDELPGPGQWDPSRYLALDEALDRLDALSPRLRQVISLRFLLGLTVEETATELGLAPSSVRKDAQLAKAWLHKELGGPSAGASPPREAEP